MFYTCTVSEHRSALLGRSFNPRRRWRMRPLVVGVVPFGGSNTVSWNYSPVWCSYSCCRPKPYQPPHPLLPPPSHPRCRFPYRPLIYLARGVGVEAVVAVLRTMLYRRPRRDGEHHPYIKPPRWPVAGVVVRRRIYSVRIRLDPRNRIIRSRPDDLSNRSSPSHRRRHLCSMLGVGGLLAAVVVA